MRSTTSSGSAAATSVIPDGSAALSGLYGARFTFAVVWAGLLALCADSINPLSAVLLVVYPVVDLAAAVVDLRTTQDPRARTGLHANAALSLLSAIGLGVAATSGTPDMLRVWGAWAITAGLAQLVVALRRRRLGGQWPLTLSGAISVLAGTGFVSMASGDDPSLTPLAGYATLGGVFFLVSTIRLRRSATQE